MGSIILSIQSSSTDSLALILGKAVWTTGDCVSLGFLNFWRKIKTCGEEIEPNLRPAEEGPGKDRKGDKEAHEE